MYMSDRLFTTASFPFVGRAGETENNAWETQAEIASGFCQVIQEVMFPEKELFYQRKTGSAWNIQFEGKCRESLYQMSIVLVASLRLVNQFSFKMYIYAISVQVK